MDINEFTDAYARRCCPVCGAVIVPNHRGVATVQAWLKKLSSAGLAVDGQSGPKTKEALVRALQKYFVGFYGCKITVDGSFCPEMKAACRIMKKGDKGLLVSIFQAGLLAHGIRDTKIDAIFGAVTKEDVRQFQKEAGIVVDGIAGRDV